MHILWCCHALLSSLRPLPPVPSRPSGFFLWVRGYFWFFFFFWVFLLNEFLCLVELAHNQLHNTRRYYFSLYNNWPVLLIRWHYCSLESQSFSWLCIPFLVTRQSARPRAGIIIAPKNPNPFPVIKHSLQLIQARD